MALAISLHAPNDQLALRIMPINDKYNIESFLAGVRRYLAKSNANGGRVTVEYVLLDHINDDMQHAHELAKVLKTPAKINLIPFNPFPGNPFGKPSNSRIDRFSKVLMEYGLTVIVRKTRGDDIDAAACGQLVGEVIDRTKRTMKIGCNRMGFPSKWFNSKPLYMSEMDIRI